MMNTAQIHRALQAEEQVTDEEYAAYVEAVPEEHQCPRYLVSPGDRRTVPGDFTQSADHGKGKKSGPNRRGTIYKVMWQRGNSSPRSRLFTRAATADAYAENLRARQAERPLNYVRVLVSATFWDEVLER